MRIYITSCKKLVFLLLRLYSCFSLGSIRFNITPINEASPIPAREKLPQVKTAPPMPIVSTRDTIIMFRVFVRFTLLFIKLAIPAQAIVPNSKSIMPPRTDFGIELRSALIFPTVDRSIAVTAAIRITCGLVILVNDIAPITSE